MDSQKRKKFMIVVVTVGVLLAGLFAFVLIHNLSTGDRQPISKHPTLTPTTQPQPSPQAGQVFQYETAPDAHKSSISLQANGQDVFVEQYKDSNYARFAFKGAVTISISSP